MASSPASRDLVLVGAGHTNLHVIRMWRSEPIAGVNLTVVSPFGRATYSGMLAGTLAGLYEPDAMQIDLARLCESCGARLIVDEAVGLDVGRRRVLLVDRPPLPFDVASIGIGSVPGGGDVWRNQSRVLSIKPMATFLRRLEEGLNAAAAAVGKTLNIAVVGAGAAGVEVIFCLDAYLKKRATAAALTLLDVNETILAGYAPRTIALAKAELKRRGIVSFTERRVAGFADCRLQFEMEDPLPADLVIWATGAAPPPLLEHCDLPRADDGFLAVRSTLRTTADAPVFVVGDAATLIDHPVPKAGVYAVREGPVVWENMQRTFAGREMVPYDPQRGFLSMLSTGDGRAIAQYKGYSLHGGWVWKWKDWIDRKFVRQYQEC